MFPAFSSRSVTEKDRHPIIAQEEHALKFGDVINFVRQLEQGKPTLRMDKVNQVLAMFGYELAPVRTDELNEKS